MLKVGGGEEAVFRTSRCFPFSSL